MTRSRIGASARLFANVLTLALSTFAAWGWSAEISAWPPSLTSAGWLVLAVISLGTQQLANASTALAQRAFHDARWTTGIAGLALALVFAGVTAKGVEHGWAATLEMRQMEATAPLSTEIAALEADIEINHAALRAIPSDIPGSRIEILQTPWRDAIAQAETRLEQLRVELDRAAAPDDDAEVRLIFWLLGFAEPALYWLLAASEAGVSQHTTSQRRVPPQHHVPARRPQPAVPSQVRRRLGVLRAAAIALRRALSALALFAPGASTPPNLPRADVASVQASGTGEAPEAGAQDRMGRVPDHAGRQSRPGRGTPDWLEAAQAMRRSGLSYRAIARRVDVPKSTVARWLKRAAETSGRQRRP